MDYDKIETEVEKKAELRDKKKRKRMHQSGKSVFTLQQLISKPSKKKKK
jgi:hypothetical protein